MPLRSCRHQLRLAAWHDQPLRGKNVRQVAMALQAVQCAAVQRAAVQCAAVQCAAVQCAAIHCAATLICIPLSLRRWNPRLLQEVTSRKVIFDVKRKKHAFVLFVGSE